MYALIGIRKFLQGCVMLAALLAAAHLAMVSALGQLDMGGAAIAKQVWTSAQLGLTVSLGFIALGETAVFPWMCRRTAIGKWFTAIEGVWTGSLESNINIIAEKDAELLKHVTTNIIPVELLVKARLLSVSVALRSRPLNSTVPYQTSETIAADIHRVGSDGRVRLAYVFEAKMPKSLDTDTTMHMGAAVLTLSEMNGLKVFDGDYCTNRNWQQARNTAGRASFTLSGPIAEWFTRTTLNKPGPGDADSADHSNRSSAMHQASSFLRGQY